MIGDAAQTAWIGGLNGQWGAGVCCPEAPGAGVCVLRALETGGVVNRKEAWPADRHDTAVMPTR